MTLRSFTVSTLAVAALLTTLLLQGCGKAGPAPAADSKAAVTDSTPAVTPAADQKQTAGAPPGFQDLQGKPVALAAYAGKKVFVNFWATWCAPCIREIPSIARAAQTLSKENYVFLLASDENLDTINNFIQDRGFTGNFLKLNGYVGSLGINVMPTSVLYDEHGAVVRSWQGSFEWDKPEMLAQVRGKE